MSSDEEDVVVVRPQRSSTRPVRVTAGAHSDKGDKRAQALARLKGGKRNLYEVISI
jgi:hypothetical protein